jgi:hypothetical protein
METLDPVIRRRVAVGVWEDVAGYAAIGNLSS